MGKGGKAEVIFGHTEFSGHGKRKGHAAMNSTHKIAAGLVKKILKLKREGGRGAREINARYMKMDANKGGKKEGGGKL